MSVFSLRLGKREVDLLLADTRRRQNPLVADLNRNLAFEYVEAFLFSTVNVKGWTAAGRDDSFAQGILAVRFIASCNKAVDVANDGNGPAFVGHPHSMLVSYRSLR